MVLDDALKFGSNQAVVDPGAYMTNANYDNGVASPHPDLGAGEELCLVFMVDVAAAGSTDTTDLIAVQSTAQNLAGHTELAKRRIANANLTAGSLHIVPLPPGAVTKQYVGGRVELGAGDTITVSCWLARQKDVSQADPYYTSGFQA